MHIFYLSSLIGAAYVVKEIDVTFDSLKWRLTQHDGQLGIADVNIRKFK